MEQAAFADGVLPKKVKELTAVGTSVVINCKSCMQRHIEQAAAACATEREALDAIEVSGSEAPRPRMRGSRSV